MIIIAATACVIYIKPDNRKLVEKVNNAEEVVVIKPVEAEPSDPQEAKAIMAFYNTIKNALQENDFDSLNDLLFDGNN